MKPSCGTAIAALESPAWEQVAAGKQIAWKALPETEVLLAATATRTSPSATTGTVAAPISSPRGGHQVLGESSSLAIPTITIPSRSDRDFSVMSGGGGAASSSRSSGGGGGNDNSREETSSLTVVRGGSGNGSGSSMGSSSASSRQEGDAAPVDRVASITPRSLAAVAALRPRSASGTRPGSAHGARPASASSSRKQPEGGAAGGTPAASSGPAYDATSGQQQQQLHGEARRTDGPSAAVSHSGGAGAGGSGGGGVTAPGRPASASHSSLLLSGRPESAKGGKRPGSGGASGRLVRPDSAGIALFGGAPAADAGGAAGPFSPSGAGALSGEGSGALSVVDEGESSVPPSPPQSDLGWGGAGETASGGHPHGQPPDDDYLRDDSFIREDDGPDGGDDEEGEGVGDGVGVGHKVEEGHAYTASGDDGESVPA